MKMSSFPKITRVNVEVKNASIQSVLNDVLRNTSLSYRILNTNLVVLSATPAQLVSRNISGRITDETGQPLAGVSVKLRGSVSGVSTSADGSFSIEAPDRSVLEISYVGYLSQEITVIIALWTCDWFWPIRTCRKWWWWLWNAKKINLTGAVDAVTGKQIETGPLMNLRRRAGIDPEPEYNDTSTDAPQQHLHLIIRGLNTSLNGGDPLILKSILFLLQRKWSARR